MLIDVSMHAPPQDVVPGAQTQALAEQTWFVPQALPQAPQFAGSLVVSTQRPPQEVPASAQTRPASAGRIAQVALTQTP
jgi:hypothetical protein